MSVHAAVTIGRARARAVARLSESVEAFACAHQHGQDRTPLVGTFPEFNRQSVIELGQVPVSVPVARLRRAQRRFAGEMLTMSPSSRMTIKVGATGGGPLEFALKTDAHIRGHLDEVRRYRRRLLRSSDASVDDQP